jgi:hypothetical protein
MAAHTFRLFEGPPGAGVCPWSPGGLPISSQREGWFDAAYVCSGAQAQRSPPSLLAPLPFDFGHGLPDLLNAIGDTIVHPGQPLDRIRVTEGALRKRRKRQIVARAELGAFLHESVQIFAAGLRSWSGHVGSDAVPRACANYRFCYSATISKMIL